MENALFRGNREPSLDEILAEPIVRMVMKRDGASESTIRALMRQAAGPPAPPKPYIVPAAALIGSSEPPPASSGMLAQAPTPAWPRVFPSL